MHFGSVSALLDFGAGTRQAAKRKEKAAPFGVVARARAPQGCQTLRGPALVLLEAAPAVYDHVLPKDDGTVGVARWRYVSAGA